MHELGNRVVELSDLLGADAQRWAERLLDISGWQDRFALLDGPARRADGRRPGAVTGSGVGVYTAQRPPSNPAPPTNLTDFGSTARGARKANSGPS